MNALLFSNIWLFVPSLMAAILMLSVLNSILKFVLGDFIFLYSPFNLRFATALGLMPGITLDGVMEKRSLNLESQVELTVLVMVEKEKIIEFT